METFLVYTNTVLGGQMRAPGAMHTSFAGECLVDDVEVFAAGGGNRISNPGFENGMSGWVAQGNHENSGLEAGDGYNNSAHCLHVRATDHGDTGANRIRTTLTSPLTALSRVHTGAWPSKLLLPPGPLLNGELNGVPVYPVPPIPVWVASGFARFGSLPI